MIIGRKEEQSILNKAFYSEYSEFIAVYGRRRVGKTFLVRESFDYRFTFQHAGIYLGDKKTQLFAFAASLKDAGYDCKKSPGSWLEAFELLKDFLRSNIERKKVIFIDELSWMDSQKSDLIMALEHFWNGWASSRRDIVLIVCSSVTSWMINKIIHNKGGLYNRLTGRIFLKPFSLAECEMYSESENLAFTRYQIMELYMALGGIPYYWSFLQKGMSVAQNLDHLFFSRNAPLSEEYDHLIGALFKFPDEYEIIIKALYKKQTGLTRNEIIKATGIAGSGVFSKKLKDLESIGFIRCYSAYEKKKKDCVYQITDPFLLFYYHFDIAGKKDANYFTNQVNTPRYNTWSGLAFENLCLTHIDHIKKALGIAGVYTECYSWSCKRDDEKGLFGSQIDLLLVRQDNVINIFETKFSKTEYIINKKTIDSLLKKRNDFVNATKTKSGVHISMITPYGIEKNSYSGEITSEIKGDQLFE